MGRAKAGRKDRDGQMSGSHQAQVVSGVEALHWFRFFFFFFPPFAHFDAS